MGHPGGLCPGPGGLRYRARTYRRHRRRPLFRCQTGCLGQPAPRGGRRDGAARRWRLSRRTPLRHRWPDLLPEPRAEGLHRGRDGVVVWRRVPRAAHRQRRDLRQGLDHGRASDAALAELRSRHEPQEQQIDDRAGQRSRPLPWRPRHGRVAAGRRGPVVQGGGNRPDPGRLYRTREPLRIRRREADADLAGRWGARATRGLLAGDRCLAAFVARAFARTAGPAPARPGGGAVQPRQSERSAAALRATLRASAAAPDPAGRGPRTSAVHQGGGCRGRRRSAWKARPVSSGAKGLRPGACVPRARKAATTAVETPLGRPKRGDDAAAVAPEAH